MLASAWSIRGPPSAPTTTTPVRIPAAGPPRTASSVSDSSLSRRARSIGTPARLERRELGSGRANRRRRPSRSIATPSGRRVARAAVGGDDQVRPPHPSPARSASSCVTRRARRRRRGSGRPSRPMLPRPIRPAWADARLPAVPDSPPPFRRPEVVDAAARKGVDLQVRVLDTTTHTAADAAPGRRRVGQIVKSLVFVAPRRGRPRAHRVPGRRAQPGRRRPPRRGHSEPGVRRATAREAPDLTGFSIGGIPPIGHARARSAWSRTPISADIPKCGPRPATTGRVPGAPADACAHWRTRWWRRSPRGRVADPATEPGGDGGRALGGQAAL